MAEAIAVVGCGQYGVLLVILHTAAACRRAAVRVVACYTYRMQCTGKIGYKESVLCNRNGIWVGCNAVAPAFKLVAALGGGS